MSNKKKQVKKQKTLTTKTKRRNFNIYITELFTNNETKHNPNFGWNEKHANDIKKLLLLISNQAIEDKIMTGKENDKWTMFLEACQEMETFIQGYFMCTADSMHTKLFDNITFEVSDNKKRLTQNEIMKTGFSIRNADGMLTIGEYGGNIAKTTRLAIYLNTYLLKYKESGQLITDITKISFIPCISDDFLDKINSNFDRLNSAQITVEVPVEINECDDAFSTLANETLCTNIGKITIILQRKDSNGLSMSHVKSWLYDQISKYNVIRGVLNGHPNPGMQKKLSLKGINKSFPYDLKISNDGEVLLGEIYAKIEHINATSPSLF